MSPIPVFGCQFQKKSCADAFAEFHKVDHAEQVMFEQLEVAALPSTPVSTVGLAATSITQSTGPSVSGSLASKYRHVLSGFLVACVSPT